MRHLGHVEVRGRGLLGCLLEVVALLWRVAIEGVETTHYNADWLRPVIQKVDRVADGNRLLGHLAVGDVRGRSVDQDGMLDVAATTDTCLM